MKYKITYLDEELNRKTEYSNLDKNQIIYDFNQAGFRIINIETTVKKKKTTLKTNVKRLKVKDISQFLKQLSILLDSGLDFKLAISILKDQEKNKYLKASLYEIDKNIDQGYSIAEAFKRTENFPDLVVGIIEAGEASSSLGESLNILAEYYDNEEKTKQMLKNALYYPTILLIVTMIVTILMVYIVLPRYVELFSYYDGMELPGLTKRLLNTSNFLLNKGWILLLAIIGLAALIKKALPKNTKLWFSKARLSYPFIGSYILSYEIQRFSGIFALLIDSGIETLESINKAAKSINNIYLREKLCCLNKDILEGHTLYETFSKIEILPPMFINLINVGELSSSLSKTMEISFNYYKNIVSEKSKKLTSLFEPLIIILVSLIVGTVVVAIALPMFSLVNLVNF
ncbi:type II secretion system F family protein [Neofamilia massiliensis]|uniref:type II secretion system F family protein n=1 Tax=Neofamilia massiliensis TaxID=1673724 RepID=UPI0006BB6B98|nr:type II secretion system F family protein [Neofamilia massiliensis]